MCAVFSWSVLAVTAAIMGGSAGPWLGFLWAMYGTGNYPVLTELYLSSTHWWWAIPMVATLPIVILWKKERLDRYGCILQTAFHCLSLAIFLFASFAAVQPFLTTTFGMGKQTSTDDMERPVYL